MMIRESPAQTVRRHALDQEHGATQQENRTMNLSPKLYADIYALASDWLYTSIHREVMRDHEPLRLVAESDARNRARAIRIIEALGHDPEWHIESSYRIAREIRAENERFEARLAAEKARVA